MPEKDAWTHKVATVLQFIDEGHAERGWKTCEQLLKEERPARGTAVQKTFVACLIAAGKFQKAVDYLTELKNTEMPGSMLLEHAYCLYKLNRSRDALELIRSGATETSSDISLIRAQALYKLEEFKDSSAIYDELLHTEKLLDLNEEMAVNQLACASCDPALPATALSQTSDASYEAIFNECSLKLSKCLHDNQYSSKALMEILEKLNQAQVVCTDNADSAEEAEREEATIVLQKLIVKLIFGHHDLDPELNLVKDILPGNKLDAVQRTIASLNMCDYNLNTEEATIRILKNKLKAPEIRMKLQNFQEELCIVNDLILLHKNRNDEQMAKFQKKLKGKNSILMQALVHIKQKNIDQAIKVVRGSISSSKKDPALIFVLSQLHLLAGDRVNAIKVLDDLPVDAFSSTVALEYLISIHSQTDFPVIEKFFDESARKCSKSADLDTLKMSFGYYCYVSGQFLKAKKIFASKLDGNNLALPGHVLSFIDEENQSFFTGLKSLKSSQKPSSTVSNTDIENSWKAFDWLKLTGATHDGSKKKRDLKPRKKRPGKLPKNYDPNVKPDPERWIPKVERKSYQKKLKKMKRKNKNYDVSRGPQGAVTDETEAAIKSPLSPVKPVVTSSKNPPNAHKKKKKGKGKW